MLMKRFHNQRGDTIVEVMISIAIIGLILAGAYATANRSLTNVRDAEEHEQAIALAQGQLELLDGQNTTALDTIGAAPGGACFNSSGILGVYPATTDVGYTNNCTNFDGYPEDYAINLTQVVAADPPSQPLATYKVSIDWPRLGGGTDNVQMFYQPPGGQ